MSITLTRQGSTMKLVDTGKPEPLYFNLFEIELTVSGDVVRLQDATNVDYNDVTSPVVASAVALADQIGTWIQEAMN